MAVAIRESPTEIEERLMAEERFPDAALLSKRLGISSDALIRELVSARSAARLMAYEREKGTTLPTREASGIFIVPRVELVFRRDEEEFETAYDRLGVWAGPYSSRSAIKSELDFWRASGAQGASWLVQRIRNESGNETLNAVANILSNVDTTSLSVVLGTLQAAPTPDQAYCLLETLGRMGPQSEEVAHRLKATIRRYISHREFDLRQASVSATSALPARDALEILRAALATETDSAITKAIQDEIEERIAQ